MPGGRDHGPVLRRLGRGPRPARRARGRPARRTVAPRRACRAGAALRGAARGWPPIVVARRRSPRSAVAQPWRAEDEGDEALRCSRSGDFAGARAAAERARDINPLSAEPYFERAAIEDAAGNRAARAEALEDAVRLEPASPEAWRRLGEYCSSTLDEPGSARSRCCAARCSSTRSRTRTAAPTGRAAGPRGRASARRARRARRAARRAARQGERRETGPRGAAAQTQPPVAIGKRRACPRRARARAAAAGAARRPRRAPRAARSRAPPAARRSERAV